MRTVAYFLLFLLPICVSAQPADGEKRITPEEYIELYKDIAMAEMQRVGIPASIKLAQGLLESGSGNSELSKRSNNHFGIKCKSGWTGHKTYYDDDAKDECFRVYRDPGSSYEDHSEFLVSSPRYDFLFELEVTDYESWAKGLKKAGYATNPRYPELLLGLIERYQLFEYDQEALGHGIAKSRKSRNDDVETEVDYFAFNDFPAAEVMAGDDVRSFSERYDMRPWQVRKYNDMLQSDPLVPGMLLYLKPKRGRPDQDFHVVQDGETMHYIAQARGIKLKKLLRKNRMDYGQEPMPGEKLNLRKKRDEMPKLLPAEEGLQMRKVLFVPQDKRTTPIKEEPAAAPAIVEATPEEEPKARKPKREPREMVAQDDTEEPAEVTQPIAEKPKQEPKKRTKRKAVAKTQPEPEDEEQFVYNPEPAAGKGPEQPAPTEPAIEITPVQEEVVTQPEPQPEAVKPTPAPAKHVSQPKPVAKEHPAVVNPSVRSDTLFHEVNAGETLYAISRKYNLEVNDLRRYNGLQGNSISVGQHLVVSLPQAAEPVYHTVEAGQTLYAISRLHGVSVEEIMKLNKLSNFDISVGQKLRVQ